jgi:hypothetical protein
MSGGMFKAEISSSKGRVMVAVTTPDEESVFSRSFHAICDAERWLARLARVGPQKRECIYLLEKGISPFELGALGQIRISDKRTSRRFQLPKLFY